MSVATFSPGVQNKAGVMYVELDAGSGHQERLVRRELPGENTACRPRHPPSGGLPGVGGL